VNHRRIRISLYSLLLVAALFAGAPFLLPYEWKSDPEARFKIAATQVKRDRDYYWINVHLKKSGELPHDLMKPVRLIPGSLDAIEPADMTFGGSPETGTAEMWVKFWVPAESTSGPLYLKINDGQLNVKTSKAMPSIGDSMMRTFTNPRWNGILATD
jgi:hypothetical protein